MAGDGLGHVVVIAAGSWTGPRIMLSPIVLSSVGIASGVALVFGLRWIAARRRRMAFERVAGELGFEFDRSGAGAMDLPAALRFDLFERGRSRRARNLMTGELEGLELRIFDYLFTTGGGKAQRTRRQTVFRFDTPEMTLPRLSLHPARLHHRIGALFGRSDINFDEYPVFSMG